jgi:hypothetical protein
MKTKKRACINTMGATLNRLMEAEGASNAVIAQGCGEFYAQVLAALSVESGETQEQLEQRMTIHTRALQEAVLRRAQAMWRARPQAPPAS